MQSVCGVPALRFAEGGGFVEMTASDVLIVIDMQRDFLPGGSLAVPGGDDIVPLINRLGQQFQNVVLTQDWHPGRHISFASRHGLRAFEDTTETADGIQALWPDHCVQGTPGADPHPDLRLPHAALILRKGFRPDVDSYSVFRENDRRTPTGLHGYLQERGQRRVFLCGVAWEFCVGWSALDARELGYETVVVEDAVRGISPEGVAAMNKRWREAGVGRITTSLPAAGQVTI